MFLKERDKVVFNSEFVSLIVRDNWYYFSHNNKSNGFGVIILPYDLRDVSDPKILARFERTICHIKGYSPDNNDIFMTSITGQMDKPEKSAEQTAIQELKEEAGIIANSEDLEYLGYTYPSKMSDSEYYIFAYDASNSELNIPEGDGSLGEKDSFVRWERANFVIENCNCPMVSLAYVRLINKKLLENYFNKL
jgi:8-oxo-dGTP pyrophosphatase MutT (NUDIX family)